LFNASIGVKREALYAGREPKRMPIKRDDKRLRATALGLKGKLRIML
jgi:hypothetical protein